MTFFKNICGTLGAKGIYVVCGVLSGMITARWLGPHDRGVLAVVTALPATIWMLASFGINQANVYFISKRTIPLNKIIANAFTIPVLSGLSICLFLWLTKNVFILKFLPTLTPNYLLLILSLVPIMMLQNSYLGVLRGTEKFSLINFRQVVRNLAGLLLSVIALIILQGKVTSMVVGIIIIEFMYTAWLLLEINKIAKITFSYDLEAAKPIFLFGVKSYLQNMIGYLHNRIDLYLIAYFLPSSEIAFYDIAVILGEMLLFLPQSVTFVILPKLVKLSQEDRVRVATQTGRIAIAIIFIASMLLLSSGKFLIGLVYGQDYLKAATPLFLLLPGLLFSCTTSITVPYFTSMHRQKITIFASLVSLSANIVLNILFIPLYGIAGAAISTSITYSLFAISLIIIFKVENKICWWELLMIQKADILLIKSYLKK